MLSYTDQDFDDDDEDDEYVPTRYGYGPKFTKEIWEWLEKADTTGLLGKPDKADGTYTSGYLAEMIDRVWPAGAPHSKRHVAQIRKQLKEDRQNAVSDNRGRQDVPVGQKRVIDMEGAREATRQLLTALGEDPDREGLRDTPDRVARFYQEFLSKQVEKFTLFENETGYQEIVSVREIEFTSLCEHHLLPFTGVAHVAYKPNSKIAGLSKLARVVDMFAGGLQLQEQLTNQVADFLYEALDPQLVAVRLEAVHNCMGMRGVKKPSAVTVTQALRGTYASPEERREVLSVLVGA